MHKKACFTGHRPNKFPFQYNERDPQCINLKKMLSSAIEDAIKMGYDHFISGMALGVDTWAAEAVLELKNKYPHIKLEAAIPCIGQSSRWAKGSRERYEKILERADIITRVTNNTFEEDVYFYLHLDFQEK